MRISHVLAQVALSAAFLLAAVAPACAYDTSASGGLFIEKSGDTTAGVILTQHIRSILHVPGFRTQISLAAPLATGGRYAASLEWRHGFLNTTYVGGGVGFGKWDRQGSTGALYDLIGGTRVAKHTYVEGRLYNPISSKVGHAGFLGLTFFF